MTNPAVIAESNKQISQSNMLIEASYNLTTQEKRLILFSISHLHSKIEPPKDGKVRVGAKEFSETFDLEKRHAYSILNECADKLYERNLRVLEGGVLKEKQRWLHKIIYEEGSGHIDIFFTAEILQHLTMLSREFTTFKLKYVSKLKTFYGFRIYELMAQFKSCGMRVMTVEQIRERLGVGDKYPTINDFKRYVLNPAVKEINDKTDLMLTLEPVKAGRCITGYKFFIHSKAALAKRGISVEKPD